MNMLWINAIYCIIMTVIIFTPIFTPKGSDVPKYPPYTTACLPVIFLIFVFMGFVFGGMDLAMRKLLSMCFNIFLQISIYYAFLLALLPVLRKYFQARTCAILWMLPNYLYLLEQFSLEVPEPYIVIQTPGNFLWYLLIIWLAGFVILFAGRIISHMIARRNLLKNARPIEDVSILELWKQELDDANMYKPHLQLLYSPDISTPLTLGLFARTMKVILPDTSYSSDELKWIFRHEIVHIGRDDCWNKFFFVFCTSMCWFNPLMWSAMKKCADDLELSCDETVLADADDINRLQYANLLLSTAGEAQGFSTCLSAKASSLRHRLKCVVKPPKRHHGLILICIVFFVLFMGYGYVSLTYDEQTGKELIFQSQNPETYTFDSEDEYICKDKESFINYLSNLKMAHYTGNYSYYDKEERYYLYFLTPEGNNMYLRLCDEVIEVGTLDLDGFSYSYYYLTDGIDWEYLNELLTPI